MISIRWKPLPKRLASSLKRTKLTLKRQFFSTNSTVPTSDNSTIFYTHKVSSPNTNSFPFFSNNFHPSKPTWNHSSNFTNPTPIINSNNFWSKMIWPVRIHWSAFMKRGKTKFRTLLKSWIKRKLSMRKRDSSLISYRRSSCFKNIWNSKKPEELPLLARLKRSRNNLKCRQRTLLKTKSATLTKKYSSENYKKPISRLNDCLFWLLCMVLIKVTNKYIYEW